MFRVTADTVRVHVPFTRIGRVKMSFVHFNNIINSMFSRRSQKWVKFSAQPVDFDF